MDKDPSFAPGNRLLGTRTGRGEEQVDLCGVTYANCKDTTHLVKDCKYKFSGHSFEKGKIAQSKVTYFESEFQLEDEEESIIHLMEESVNKALLDTGASTVDRNG